jgi:hypothetical protein
VNLGKRASVDDMIATFVRGEYDSARFGANYRVLLAGSRFDRSIIDKPDISDARQNKIRRRMLQIVRGYPDRLLFTDFPVDKVKWRWIDFDNDEVGQLWYAHLPTWHKLSSGTRVVADGAANLNKIEVEENGISINDSIRTVEQRLRSGEAFSELILVGQSLHGPFVTMEGHTRATAYAVVGADVAPRVRGLVGIAPVMDGWRLFEDKTTR